MGNDHIERCILGTILLGPRAYSQADGLCSEDFSLDWHRKIFSRIRDLEVSGRPIDLLTLQEELQRHGELELVGGVAYLSGLLDGVPEQPSITHYVKMLRSGNERKRAGILIESAYRLAEDPTVPTAALASIGSDLAELATGLEALPPRFSEEALTLRFSRQYAEDLRYVATWGRWMRWDGTRWVHDDTLDVFDLARGICRAASSECSDNEKATATRLASKATSAAVESLAKADRRHAAKAEQWDANPWLLNTPAGTVDLHTGKLREHRRDDYLTKVASAGPGGSCPVWMRFLSEITGGDLELRSYLQRLVGYCLTGSTREHALFFFYGTGANGKSVFLSTISKLLADYAKTAAASSFTATANEQHPTDLAGLRGARLVTAIETEDGARWAESKIKSLTGGDKISARFMRCDFVEFTPEFKLVIAGNHKPGLRSVDEAIRRRLHLVPFTVTIPYEHRDPGLAEKLSAELSGILAWAIEGCVDWLDKGLNPPKAVLDATAAYLDSEDTVGRWLEDRCTIGQEHWTATSVLFLDWQRWCKLAGEREVSLKHFSQQLEAHGFQRQRTNRAKGFIGVALQVDVVPDVPGHPISTVQRECSRTPVIGGSGTSGTDKEPVQ